MHELFIDTEKGLFYLIMEYVKGKEMFKVLKKNGSYSGFIWFSPNFPYFHLFFFRIQEFLASKLFKQILNAIFYLHSHGICHRDLKPNNILCALGFFLYFNEEITCFREKRRFGRENHRFQRVEIREKLEQKGDIWLWTRENPNADLHRDYRFFSTRNVWRKWIQVGFFLYFIIKLNEFDNSFIFYLNSFLKPLIFLASLWICGVLVWFFTQCFVDISLFKPNSIEKPQKSSFFLR